jgi:hypothetical protein
MRTRVEGFAQIKENTNAIVTVIESVTDEIYNMD